MALIIDQDMSGNGEITFSPATLVSGLIKVTAIGPKTTTYGVGTDRRLANFGWVAYGWNFTDARGYAGNWYHEPQWINMEEWTFWPMMWAGGVICERFRWSLGPGNSAYALIFS